MTLRRSQMALLALYAAPQIVLANDAASLPTDSQIVVVDAKPNASATTTLAEAGTTDYYAQQQRVVVSSAEVAAANAMANTSTPQQHSTAQQHAVPAENLTINEDLWMNMRSSFYMDRYNSEVQRWANWYASRPQHVDTTLARSEQYLWHISDAVRDRGMPR